VPAKLIEIVLPTSAAVNDELALSSLVGVESDITPSHFDCPSPLAPKLFNEIS
jgi:hypothetical protein